MAAPPGDGRDGDRTARHGLPGRRQAAGRRAGPPPHRTQGSRRRLSAIWRGGGAQGEPRPGRRPGPPRTVRRQAQRAGRSDGPRPDGSRGRRRPQDRRRDCPHRRSDRTGAGPVDRPLHPGAAGARVGSGTEGHRSPPAGQPGLLPLPGEAAAGQRRTRLRPADQRCLPRRRLARPCADPGGAGHEPLHRPDDALPDPCRADRASGRRDGDRERRTRLSRRADGDHRHLQVRRRAGGARLPHLSDPGDGPRGDRRRRRARAGRIAAHRAYRPA